MREGGIRMTKLRIRSLLVVLLGAVLVLSACGGGKKNIAIGPPASETNNVAKIILDAYGVGDGDYKAFLEGFGAAADGVQDGNIDISIGILGLPAASIESLQASAGDVKMISLSDDAIKKIEEKSGYKHFTIPKETYDFLKEDVQTITAFAILMGNTNTIDEELGYELAKSMIENASENTHAQAKQMILENALNGAEGLLIHPGAKKYYEEQGLTVTNEVATVSASAGDRKSEFTLGTGSQGGTYYPLGGEMANLWNKYIDGINVTNMETGASVENMSSISKDQMDLGMSVHVPALNALNGKADFEGNPVSNAAFIGHIYPEVVQIVTREKTKINGFEDLKK